MIYTVKPGDTLFSIALRFGTTPEYLISENRLPGSIIFEGQKLVIPGSRQQQTIYIVKPGDSLFKIARQFNTTVEGIVTLNNLSVSSVYVGQRLIIPLYSEAVVNVNRAGIRREPRINSDILATMVRGARLPVIGSRDNWYRVRLFNEEPGWILKNAATFNAFGGDKPISQILGYYTVEEGAGLPSSFNSFVQNTALISQLPLFFYRISANNPTEIEKFAQFTDRDVENLVAIAHRNNIKILPVVHNLLYRPGGTDLAKRVIKVLVSDKRNRAAFIQNLINLIERFNFDGANIDIEDVSIEDSAGVSALYTEMGAAFRRRGLFLSASVPARIRDYPPFNPFSDPFDYAAIGKAVNQFVVMLYNEHGWPGSGPGPVVSIGWMERVLKYTITKMPAEKVIAAVSVFGFDFNLTTGRNTYVTYPVAMDIARRYNKTVIFDQATKTPMFSYQDEQGNRHEVWFENAESIRAKAQLAWDLGTGGLALWRLGMEDKEIWTMLSRDVVVRKY